MKTKNIKDTLNKIEHMLEAGKLDILNVSYVSTEGKGICGFAGEGAHDEAKVVFIIHQALDTMLHHFPGSPNFSVLKAIANELKSCFCIVESGIH